MASCTSCSGASQAYSSAQSYIRDQLNNFAKPGQTPEPDNAAEPQPSLNKTGRGQLVNIQA